MMAQKEWKIRMRKNKMDRKDGIGMQILTKTRKSNEREIEMELEGIIKRKWNKNGILEMETKY